MSATLSVTLFTSMSATMSNFMSACHCVQLHVSHHVGHLVYLNVCQHNIILTLCEGIETLSEWKSESITDGRTDEGRC